MKIEFPCVCVSYSRRGHVLFKLENENCPPFHLDRAEDRFNFRNYDTDLLHELLGKAETKTERSREDYCLEIAAIMSLILDSLPQEVWEAFGNTPVIKLPKIFRSKIGLRKELIKIDDFIVRYI